MKNYLELLDDVVKNGVERQNRTQINTKAVFGRMLRWDLSQGFPLQTTRKVPLRIAFEETMFFLRGLTDTKILEEKNIGIWKGNTSREFLDNRGLTNLPEGDMGKGYGYQWRHWESPHVSGQIKETDQIAELLSGIKKDPYGRRHVVTGWNPGQLEEMALPPCHMLHMYSVEGDFTVGNGRLNNCFVMRSNDIYHGLPFNITSYALLNHIFAKHLGLIPGELVYMGWDIHIYQHQLGVVNQLLERTPRTLPTLIIKKDLPTLDDILALQWEDIELIGYDPYPALEKIDMAI